MDERRFSERLGFAAEAAEITVRHDAPYDLRGLVVDFAYDSGLGPHDVRTIVCNVLMARPDESNWSPFPNVNAEVHQLLDHCKWFEVYDVIEALSEASKRRPPHSCLRTPRCTATALRFRSTSSS